MKKSIHLKQCIFLKFEELKSLIEKLQTYRGLQGFSREEINKNYGISLKKDVEAHAAAIWFAWRRETNLFLRVIASNSPLSMEKRARSLIKETPLSDLNFSTVLREAAALLQGLSFLGESARRFSMLEKVMQPSRGHVLRLSETLLATEDFRYIRVAGRSFCIPPIPARALKFIYENSKIGVWVDHRIVTSHALMASAYSPRKLRDLFNTADAKIIYKLLVQQDPRNRGMCTFNPHPKVPPKFLMSEEGSSLKSAHGNKKEKSTMPEAS
jgi:hypothetical protein